MISLDQVLLLQRKVETAVSKIKALSAEIERLNQDNALLKKEREELKAALSDRAELVSNLEAEQNRIEESIMQALTQLDTVENTLLEQQENGVQADSSNQDGAGNTPENAASSLQETVSEDSSEQDTQSAPAPDSPESTEGQTVISEQQADSSEGAEQNAESGSLDFEGEQHEDAAPINGQFDIF